MHDRDVMWISLTEVFTNHRLIQAIVLQNEVRNVLWGLTSDESIFYKGFDTSFGFEIELSDGIYESGLALLCFLELLRVVFKEWGGWNYWRVKSR